MAETGIQLGVDRALSRVLEGLQSKDRIWVTGDVGSGRTTLGHRLKDELGDNAVFVQLNEPREPDAAIGGFYELARELPDSGARAECWRDWASLTQAMEALDRAVGAEGAWTFIVHLPGSWEVHAPTTNDWDALEAHSLGRCHELIAALGRSRQNVVWITSRTTSPSFLGLADPESIPLPRPRNATALLRTVDWKTYQAAADALARSLDELGGVDDVSPVVLRLAVGVVQFGGAASVVAQRTKEFSVAGALQSLSEDLADSLLRGNEPCRTALGRLLLARKPIERATLPELTSIPDEHVPLLTDCIGYGGNEIRMSPSLKPRLEKHVSLPDELREEAHSRLHRYYTARDGLVRLSDTAGDQASAWLEKVHHLLQSSEEVDLGVLPCRELYWVHGRHLSRTRRRYSDAARVYAECAARFPNDDYAHHYWAFNLEKAGETRDVTEREYRAAADLRPDHPWWNGRLVTFLIGQGRFRAARTAWTEALDRLDPDGDRILQNPELADQLHHWVAKAWLDAGHVGDAMEILRLLPREVISRSVRLPNLRQRILSAAEADALGFAVYPDAFPVEARWAEKPRKLPWEQLREWWPGRVIEASRRSVQIGYGVKQAGELHSLVTEISPSEWRSIGFGDAHDASGYVELGSYSDGSRKIVPVDYDSVELPDDEGRAALSDAPFAYLDRWLSPTFPS